MTKTYPDIKTLIHHAGASLLGPQAKTIPPGKWQGLDVTYNMIEVFDNTFRVNIPETVEDLEQQCNPDLPWAYEHFKERVSGKPTNPGDTYKDWPYYKEDKYRESGQFTHTYQERIWPKEAGNSYKINEGIRYEYGDLQDVLNHLAENPGTRQAFLPIWFPEDTGVVHKGRVPRTLGYLFSYRHGYLHMTYYLRSCDYIRHFRNDIYMACMLLYWVLKNLKIMESPVNWSKVKPGRLKIDIESLHIFEPDTLELKKRIKS